MNQEDKDFEAAVLELKLGDRRNRMKFLAGCVLFAIGAFCFIVLLSSVVNFVGDNLVGR